MYSYIATAMHQKKTNHWQGTLILKIRILWGLVGSKSLKL